MRGTTQSVKKQKEEERQLALLAKYRKLVLKLAWEYWKRLPASVRIWVDPEDLIEEAYVYVIRQEARDYDKRRGNPTTFLWTGISNLFLNFAASYQTRKRFGWRVPLEDLWMGGEHDRELKRIEAREALEQVFKEGSPELQKEILEWFGQAGSRVKWSKAAKRLYEEFRRLAKKHGLSPEDFRQLIRSDLWVN